MLKRIQAFINDKTGIVLTIIITYFAVLALSSVVIFVMFRSASAMLREEIITRCDETIESLSEKNTNVYYSSLELLQQWSYDSELRYFNYDPAVDSLSERYEYVSIWNKIRNTYLFHNYIEYIHLYYPESDVVISNMPHLRDGDYVLNNVFPGMFSSREEMTGYLNDNTKNGANTIIINTGKENYILLWQKAMYSTSTGSEVYIFFMINTDRLISTPITETYDWDSIYFVDSGKNTLAYEGTARNQLIQNLSLTGEKGAVEDSGFIFVYNTSSIIGCRYITSFPVSVIMEKIQNIRMLTLSLSILYAVSAVFIIAWYINWNRRHINNILGIVKKHGIRIKPEKNEYNLFFSAIDTTIQDNKQIKERYDLYANVIRDSLLQKLVLGIVNTPDIDEINSYFDTCFSDTFFAVAISQVEDYHSSLYSEQYTYVQNVQLHNFAVRNVAEELLQSPFYMISTEIDNQIVMIINIPDSDPGTCDFLQQELLNVIDKCEKVLTIPLVLSLSHVKKGLDSLPVLYQQALQALRHTSVSDQPIQLYHDIDMNSAEIIPYLSALTEQQIINIIKTGDFNNAGGVITSLFADGESLTAVDEKWFRFFACGISSMFIKTIVGLNISVESIHRKILKLTEVNSFGKLKQLTLDVAEELCCLMRENNKENQKHLDDVKKYITDNYQNDSLSLTVLSDAFHISTYYLSRVFKEAFGIGIPEYVSNVRIEHAKELLTKEKLSAREIGLMVGYNDYTSFSRVFKRIVGISPQKYRDLHTLKGS
jgi:AraC-like DNA-binding protein